MNDPQIVIVEFGSQYTKLIAKSLREIGYRSAVLPPKQAERWIRSKDPRAIIMSGSQYSVNAGNSPLVDKSVFETRRPLLGICYGMQLTAKMLGGSVVSAPTNSEFGPSQAILDSSQLFDGVPKDADVWASHGDSVESMPTGFRVTARSPTGAIAAMEDAGRAIYGLQFHPEVEGTPFGKQILGNFVGGISGCQKDWKPEDIVMEIQSFLRSQLSDGRAIIAFSGGVDSTTLAAIASPVLGARFKAVCVDGGQLREGELDEIRKHASFANVPLDVIYAEREFLDAFRAQVDSTPDPELKRKQFRRTYEECLTKAAKDWNATHFIQGTLAPDMIESGQTGGDVIKTHHNIGVKAGNCVSLHPFSNLFKYEVRALAEDRELPESVVKRQPFPGPGLFVRIIGWPTAESLEVLRWADKKVTDIAKRQGVYDEISQLVVALDSSKFVGVKGDERSYGRAVIVRGVKTLDFMTAEGYQFPPEIRRAITAALTKHPLLTRVFWDETPKPPGTVELE